MRPSPRSATVLIATLAGALLMSGAAEAQYYDPYRPPPPPYGGGYRPGPYYGQSPYYRSGYYGRMCITSRGSCAMSRARPVGSSCTCYIPGFGKKRGGVR